MKQLVNGRFVIAVLAVVCLLTVLVGGIRSSFSGAGDYDAWLDINDDGKIDMKDVGGVARAFGTSGTNISKASIEYDSGWITITDKCGQYFNITHNLNSTDVMVDITGKTTLEGGVHQRNLGGTGYIQGWSSTYRTTDDDWAYSMIQTSDGGYLVAGESFYESEGVHNDLVVKTDANGNTQWSQTYDAGNGYSAARSLVQTSDGGYAVAGYTTCYGAVGSDFWLIKTDASGNAQWNRTYGGTDWDEAYALVQTSDGGYALAGRTESFGVRYYDLWLVKTDASGTMMWNRTYGGTEQDEARALVQTADGGYALAGYTNSFGVGNYDFWLIKTDASGNAQWNRTYGGTDWDEAYALVQTADGGYALAGITQSFGAGITDFWLVKTNVSGNVLWNKTYGGTGNDRAYALVQTSDGGYALAGYTGYFGAFNGDFWLVKTDSAGNMQWNQTYGGTSWDYALALVQTTDGGYALAGETNTFDSYGANSDFWLVKTDVESGLAWTDSSANTITLYRGATDPYWNYVRVRLWKPR